MKKMLMICCIFSLLLFACKKNNLEEPCSDPSTLIKLRISGFTSYAYHFDSLTILRKGEVYPFVRNEYGEGITIQLPPEAGVKDTFYLDWWNVPDVDTVVLNYNYNQYTKDCRNLEMDAWFNGEFYPDYHGNTFYFTKK